MEVENQFVCDNNLKLIILSFLPFRNIVSRFLMLKMNVRYGFLLTKIKIIRKSGDQKNRVWFRHDFDFRSEESCPRMTKCWYFTKNVPARHDFFFLEKR